MKKILVKILIAIIIIVSGFAIFSFGFQYGYRQIPAPPKGLPENADITLLWDVWQKIKERYPGDIDHQKMIYGAVKGLVRGLGDPYTVFFSPEDSKIFRENITGSFEGVGMEIGLRKGELTIISPLEGTPAQKAKLLPGDKIIKVGEVFTRNISLEKAVKLIRGEKGTSVLLTIHRKGWDETREFKITREVIKIPTIQWEIIEGNIAKIRIYHFSGTLNADFTQMAQKVLEGPAKKLILDLRNNPGGLLREAHLVAEWFLEKGDIITIESFGEDRKQKKHLAMGNEALKGYPIVVLINQGSASGAEILAAALRDNRDNVKLIGEKSFGKGSVQEPVDLRGGSLLKVTVARWLTPKGELISGVGLEPDIVVEMTEEDYKEKRDPQLEKAIEVLKAM